ncbi:MAG: 30S ribosomal protein S5, partial [Candidatus Gracilibacteria bacterium]|nr:30S ribosomal protein S5 [Candidatus Gracilibacteria bacterium]
MSEVKEEKTLGTEEQQEKVVQAESQEAKETDAKAPEAQQDNADKKEFAGKRRRRDKKRPIREEKEFMEEVLQIDRVTRVVKGGRRLRFRVTVIIGDKKGKVAIGIGKSAEVVGGIQKAIAKAKKSLIKVTIENGTIPHELRV